MQQQPPNEQLWPDYQRCFGCGAENKLGLQLNLYERAGAVISRATTRLRERLGDRSGARLLRDDDVSDGKVMVERDAFREALGAVCTPLAIVTSQLAARPHGTTVSAFCSLSLAPPLVLVSLDRTSRLLAMIRTTGRFGINVLEHGQHALATRFATKHDDKFADVAWSMDHGLPRIHGAGSWIACQLENLLEGGDHEIVVGLVEHAEQRARNPLLYQHRTFRRLRWIPLADSGPSLPVPARDQPRRPLGVASRDDSDGRLEKHSASASCREGR